MFLFLNQYFTQKQKLKTMGQCPTRYILNLIKGNVLVKIIIKEKLLQGYLRYKIILCHNVVRDV